MQPALDGGRWLGMAMATGPDVAHAQRGYNPERGDPQTVPGGRWIFPRHTWRKDSANLFGLVLQSSVGIYRLAQWVCLTRCWQAQ